MRSLYARWMYDWETRLTGVDNNRVVRPLEWGIEWTREWPCRNGFLSARTHEECEHYLREYNLRAVAASDEFFSYETPRDFQLERREIQVFSTRDVPDRLLENKVRGTHAEFLRFTSPVRTPYLENNRANARWFPAKGKSAIVLLPQWNSDALSHNSLCGILNRLGISALRLSMPYHDIRRPAEIRRADYAVSANIGRTIDAARQGVIDLRCCLDCSSKVTRSWESSVPAWVRVMGSLQPPTMHVSRSPHSTMLRPTLPTWSGTGSPHGIFARESNRISILIVYADSSLRSVQCHISRNSHDSSESR